MARGTPIWHILDASRTNALSHQHIAEAVAWSVRSVARGGEVLRGVRGPWEETFDIYGGHRCGSMRKVLVSSDRTDRDLHVGLGVTDRCEADRTALARGFALIIDDGALVLPGGES